MKMNKNEYRKYIKGILKESGYMQTKKAFYQYLYYNTDLINIKVKPYLIEKYKIKISNIGLMNYFNKLTWNQIYNLIY